jgi:hypothetical protein
MLRLISLADSLTGLSALWHSLYVTAICLRLPFISISLSQAFCKLLSKLIQDFMILSVIKFMISLSHQGSGYSGKFYGNIHRFH